MSPPTSRRSQASEKVHAYLDSLAGSSDGEAVRLPSVRQLAAHLGVSASTVAGVYRQNKEEGRLRATSGSGSYLIGGPISAPSTKHLRLTINLAPEDNHQMGPWYSQILGGLTMSAMAAGIRLTVQGFNTLKDHPGSLTPQDAVLVVPSREDREELIAWGREHGLPTLYLNPPADNATENFVSPDYFSSSRLLGQAFLAAGRKRILFISNLPYHHGASSRLRVSGLLAGLEYGEPNGVVFEMRFTGYDISPEAGQRSVTEYIATHGHPPDAIFTPGDYLAAGCFAELASRGISCPEEVAIAGGTGLSLDHTSCPQLTRAIHPYQALGEEIIRQILPLVAHPKRTMPGRIVPMHWIGGATTNAEENRLLFQ